MFGYHDQTPALVFHVLLAIAFTATDNDKVGEQKFMTTLFFFVLFLQGLLTLDDDLLRTPRRNIPVF